MFSRATSAQPDGRALRRAGVRLVPDLFFVVFMLSWIATRCILFPLVVIRATLIDCVVRSRGSRLIILTL